MPRSQDIVPDDDRTLLDNKLGVLQTAHAATPCGADNGPCATCGERLIPPECEVLHISHPILTANSAEGA